MRWRSGAGVCIALSFAVALGAVGASARTLPDGRVYELVSPADAGGAGVLPFSPSGGGGAPVPPVASSGDRAIFMTTAPLPGLPASGGADGYLAIRRSEGWSVENPIPPSSADVWAASVVGLSSDFTTSYLLADQSANIDPADPDAIEPGRGQPKNFDLFSRDDAGAFTRITQGPINVWPRNVISPPELLGVSADGSRVVFESEQQLTPELATGFDGRSIYERSRGTTTLVSTDTDGSPIRSPQASFAGMSADATTIAYEQGGIFDGRLDGQRVLLRADGGPAIAIAGPHNAYFAGISADGGRVYFTTPAAIADDHDTSVDLYAYEVGDRSLTRISTGAGGVGDTDACQPLTYTPSSPSGPASGCDVTPVLVSSDGSRVYFVSPELLDGANGAPGAPNLYLHAGGTTTFVATLSPQDLQAGDPAGLGFGVDDRSGSATVRATADGAHLLFESYGPSAPGLPAFDNAGHREVYEYDADRDRLTCVSCPAGAARATADANLMQHTIVPPPVPASNVTADGSTVFFETGEPLVADDTDGTFDVYERRDGGPPELISSGSGTDDSHYFGSSRDGHDVFFTTTDSLAANDMNGAVSKLYDARVGGGFPPPAAGTASCDGEECRAPLRPVPFAPLPATSTLTGAGNDAGDDDGQGAGAHAGFSIEAISGKARRALARTGRLTLVVRTQADGRVDAVAQARLGKRWVKASSVHAAQPRAGALRLRLAFSRRARRYLATHRAMRVRVDVRYSRARTAKRAAFVLRAARPAHRHAPRHAAHGSDR
jgi:hypothetical protein